MANLFLLIQKFQINFLSDSLNCLNDECSNGEINVNSKFNYVKQLYSNVPTKVETPLFIF